MTDIFSKDSYERLRRQLQGASSALIITHVNPDGDAIGSSLGLAPLLRKFVPHVQVVVPNRFPAFLGWMEGASDILVYADRKGEAEQLVEKADLIFCLDFNSLSRIDELGKLVEQSKAVRVLIDHHPDPKDEFDLSFSCVPASSTSELVYRITVALTGSTALPIGTAEAIYCGIMTDTSSFAHSSSSPDLFRIVANLLEAGVDKVKISSLVYDNFSECRMRLLGYCLSKKLVTLPQYGAAYITLSWSELAAHKFQPGDTEGFVNFPLSIRGIRLSVFLVESLDKSHIKVSVRTHGDLSANQISRDHFNGGGHKNAAGGKLFCTLREAEHLLLSILPAYA